MPASPRKIQLQLAMDDLSLKQAVEKLEELKDLIDIAEVGTPMILEYGNEAVRLLRERFPELTILADTKIMDGGYYEAAAAFRAGANLITVLGAADSATIKGCVQAAKEAGGQCVVDMICVEDLTRRTQEAEALGADVIAVHTGVDRQASGATPLQDLQTIQQAARQARVSVAGGITAETVLQYKQQNPAIVVVGGGILHQKNPYRAAAAIREALDA